MSDSLKERILKEMVRDPEQEELKKQAFGSREEAQLLKLKKDGVAIINSEESRKYVKYIDVTKYCLMYCPRCETEQPVSFTNSYYKYIHITCDECDEYIGTIELNEELRKDEEL